MKKNKSTIRIFDYIEQLDAFVVTDEYRDLAERLGLIEWNPVVWIGRLFALDNDYGEHWFDNWEEREALADEAQKLGLASEELLIINPERFTNDYDGPCHPPTLRKQFWTDVLQSLELSYETLFEEARQANAKIKDILPDEFIADLEERIAAIEASVNGKWRSRSGQDEQDELRTKPPYTHKQGQYLAFIHYYSKLHGIPPAESDIQQYFKVSPPTVHQMMVTLQERGLIKRNLGQPRTIRVVLPPEELPALE